MYNLYTDKQEIFEAKIDIQGATQDDSSCRILIESDNWNLMFSGEIDNTGLVQIPIKKLKHLFKEGDTGNIKLEVIADDVYFVPWESEFEVLTQRKVVAEVKTQKSLPKNQLEETKVKAKVISTSSPTKTSKKRNVMTEENKRKNIEYITQLSKIFIAENINLKNLHNNKKKISQIINTFVSKKKITEENTNFIVNGLMRVLTANS